MFLAVLWAGLWPAWMLKTQLECLWILPVPAASCDYTGSFSRAFLSLNSSKGKGKTIYQNLIIQCFPPIPLYLSLCLNGKWQDISQYWWVPPFLKDERLNSCPLTLPHPCFVQVSLRAVVTPCTGLSMTQGSSLAGLHRCLREQGKETWRGKTDTLGRCRKFQCLI